MEHRYCAEYGGIKLRPLHECDIECLRRWRNDRELSKYLSPVPYITEKMQKKWYGDYLKNRDVFFFTVLNRESSKTIGSVALYGFKEKFCEVGKIVIGDSTERGKGAGYSSLLMAMCIGIVKLGIERFHLNVCEENAIAYHMYKKAGFKEVDKHPFLRDGYELSMVITSEEFRRNNEMLDKMHIYLENGDIQRKGECAKVSKEKSQKENIQNIGSGGGGNESAIYGKNCVISPRSKIGSNATILHNCIIEDDVTIGDGAYIDSNTIIRNGTRIGTDSYIGPNCVIGEHQVLQEGKPKRKEGVLSIGENALIRSGSIIYTGSNIGDSFQTGHQVTVREQSEIGSHVSIGTLSDIQGHCKIGNYVRMHSNVHIGQKSSIDDYVWIFPYVVLTNDPTPPSEQLVGVHIHSFAVISTGSVLLPGVVIGKDSLVGAGTVVTRDVQPYKVVIGNPGKEVANVQSLKNRVTGEPVYPWRYHFKRGMPWENSGFEAWHAIVYEPDNGGM